MIISVERPPWYKPWRLPSNDLHVPAGSRVYCISSVFAPRGLTADLYHRWEHYDKAKGGWRHQGLGSLYLEEGKVAFADTPINKIFNRVSGESKLKLRMAVL